eukprot:12931472-Prorocentrum_lima.AAC.1
MGVPSRRGSTSTSPVEEPQVGEQLVPAQLPPEPEEDVSIVKKKIHERLRDHGEHRTSSSAPVNSRFPRM